MGESVLARESEPSSVSPGAGHVIETPVLGHDQRQGCRRLTLAACAPDANPAPGIVRPDCTFGPGSEGCNAQAIHDARNNRYLPFSGLLKLQKLLNFRQGYATIRVGFERTQWD